jgi:undecaprenyl diphosphate synthase
MNIKHIAIIMDGNGRWAKQRGLSRIEGHREGVRRVDDIINAALEQKLKALTLYVFSMENWKRPRREVYLKSEMKRLAEKNIVFRAIGSPERLPERIKKLIKDFEQLTHKNTGLMLTGALSYGSQEEIINAVRQVVLEGLSPDDINEKTFENYLYTAGLPHPDLIIRTSGEMRLSNGRLRTLSCILRRPSGLISGGKSLSLHLRSMKRESEDLVPYRKPLILKITAVGRIEGKT